MEIWTIWLIVACVLIGLEVVTQMMWALCLGLGALVALALSFTGIGIGLQITAMAVAGLGIYAAVLPKFKRWHQKQSEHVARTGMDALLGRKAIVTHSIHPDRLGRVRIDGDNWQVKAPGVDHELVPGTEVVVTGYDSIILSVEEVRMKN